MAAWFFIGGAAHFVYTDLLMTIVPPAVPAPRFWVWFTGVVELAGAVALAWHRWRRAAGWSLLAVTLAVTPAHIYMLQQPHLFGVPEVLLWLRLPLQAGLLWLIWWTTHSGSVEPGGSGRDPKGDPG